MSDAVQLLEEQHAEASVLVANAKLRDHTAIEEKIFRPAFRSPVYEMDTA